MAEQPAALEYYGVLGRVNFDGARLDLRFYPFTFDAVTPEPVVLAVSVVGDQLDLDRVRAAQGNEFNVSIFEDRVEIFSELAGTTSALYGRVTSALLHYDLDDFTDRIIQQDATYEQLTSALHKSTQKERAVLAFSQELLRRARIKSETSDEQRVRQAATISALERIIAKLQEG